MLLFYAMSMVCGGIALMGLQFGWVYPSILTALLVIVFWYFGMFLSGVVTYGEKTGGLIQGSRNFILNLFLMEKKRLAGFSQFPVIASVESVNPRNKLPESPMKIFAG